MQSGAIESVGHLHAKTQLGFVGFGFFKLLSGAMTLVIYSVRCSAAAVTSAYTLPPYKERVVARVGTGAGAN